MDKFGIGQPVPRAEDAKYLTGQGRFVDDISFPGECHGYVFRSPHAHAKINSLDLSRARSAPGVLLVWTAKDCHEAGLGKLPYIYPLAPGWDLDKLHNPGRFSLAEDRVRYVGDGVVFVVAETLNQAKDATEFIDIDYHPLESVVATADATNPDSPRIWEDCPNNIIFCHTVGDPEATEAVFAKADHIVRERLVISRVSANPLEGRAIIADYDADADFCTVYIAHQSAFGIRRQLAEDVFKEPESKFRVIIEDVGGSFGMKGQFYPEYSLIPAASKALGRPVRWICERNEAFLGDYHGRDNISEAELALDKDGKFLAIRVKTTANLGAYPSTMPTGPPTSQVGGLAGVYMFAQAHVEITGVYTNTSPVSSYRGAGRPEASYVIERMVDTAARELALDPAEIRRKNMIPADALPYRTPFYWKFKGEEFGFFEYDCGDFVTVLDKALAAADYEGFEERRIAAAKDGKYRGIGIAYIIEMAASPGFEYTEIKIDADGQITLFVGTADNGQGHHTMYTQLTCEFLGVTPDVVRIIESDTGLMKKGTGTSASRSTTMGGSAIFLAANKIIDKGKIIAAHLLGGTADDIVFEKGAFKLSSTNLLTTLAEVAKAANTPGQLPPGVEPGLCESGTHRSVAPNWPNGCHICEVEVEPETGQVRVVDYTVAEDAGTVVNPMLLTGQVKGGIMQGIGQVLMEEIVYDKDSGQLVSGSFIDYCMPRADDFVANVSVSHVPVPTKTNPLGVKGGGESGTIGALPCVMNAVIDALSPLGIRNIDMPATSEKVWAAIRAAKKQA